MKIEERIHIGEKKQKKEEVGSLLLCICIVIIIVFVFNIKFYIAIIPSPSMSPTLKVGDMIVGIRECKNINRFDVICFDGTNLIDYVKKGKYINMTKRVIGIPGDIIKLQDGELYVNGEKVEEKYVTKRGDSYMTEIKVPENKFFVMGDNRCNSYDSRYFGFIEKERIEGIHKLIIVPFYRVKKVMSTTHN